MTKIEIQKAKRRAAYKASTKTNKGDQIIIKEQQADIEKKQKTMISQSQTIMRLAKEVKTLKELNRKLRQSS